MKLEIRGEHPISKSRTEGVNDQSKTEQSHNKKTKTKQKKVYRQASEEARQLYVCECHWIHIPENNLDETEVALKLKKKNEIKKQTNKHTKSRTSAYFVRYPRAIEGKITF